MNLFVLLKLRVKHNFTMSFKTRIVTLVLTPQVLKFRVKHNFTMSFKLRIVHSNRIFMILIGNLKTKVLSFRLKP